ncbi:MAG TPA: hypothetical protein VGN36_08045, partial [Sphingorhabdus sp.]|nr:hypothetical protein [Sphingorhabdus sp.]
MSFNAKTITLSAIALIAAAVGLYAYMPGQESAADSGAPVSSTDAAAAKHDVESGGNVAEADVEGAGAAVAVQPETPTQSAV